eukprot:SM000189S04075  [mRNA]  locus=s189:66791:70607:- [translate_table: standard]
MAARRAFTLPLAIATAAALPRLSRRGTWPGPRRPSWPCARPSPSGLLLESGRPPSAVQAATKSRAYGGDVGASGGTAGESSPAATAPAGAEKFTLTTPLYYVNAAPHMGSAYPTIAADALARFQRLQGKDVTFITGTDEHGEKIAAAAASRGRQPREHCDLVAADYVALWEQLGISYNRFVRTTAPAHEHIVAEFYARVQERGDIYRAIYEGLYCVACEEYKDEKDLLEGSCCAIHRTPCSHRKEDNYFFALSKYQAALEDLLASNPDFVQPPFRRNEVLGWVKDGVRDFSISRAVVEWGIPVPSDPAQTIYVWFDALLGYVTALLGEGQDVTLENAVAGGWPAAVHIIGKDILRFHAVYWPAMLLSAGLPLPRVVFGHGFLTKDGLKMGKSLGNTLEPKELVAHFGADATRYYFLKEIEFGTDGDFNESRFIDIVNANLANTIGNLLNRTLGLLKKNCQGVIPADITAVSDDHRLRLAARSNVELARSCYVRLDFSRACEVVLAVATAGNLYLDDRAPWSQFKRGNSEAAAAAMDLCIVLETVRIIAVALSPVTPALCQRIYSQLAYSEKDYASLRWEDTAWGGLQVGQSMAEPDPVFKRIEDPASELTEAAGKSLKGGGKKKPKGAKLEAPVSS